MMNLKPPRISRRSLAIAASLAGMVSLAIGAHAALNKRALEPAKAVATEPSADKGNAAWERFKTLAGEWEAEGSMGKSQISYKVVSGATALMETIREPNAPRW